MHLSHPPLNAQQPNSAQCAATRQRSAYSQTPLSTQPDTTQRTHIPRKLAPRRSSPARQAPVISLPLRSAGPSLHPLSHPLTTHCPKSYLAPERSVLLHVALCKPHKRGEAHKHRIWMETDSTSRGQIVCQTSCMTNVLAHCTRLGETRQENYLEGDRGQVTRYKSCFDQHRAI